MIILLTVCYTHKPPSPPHGSKCKPLLYQICLKCDFGKVHNGAGIIFEPSIAFDVVTPSVLHEVERDRTGSFWKHYQTKVECFQNNRVSSVDEKKKIASPWKRYFRGEITHWQWPSHGMQDLWIRSRLFFWVKLLFFSALVYWCLFKSLDVFSGVYSLITPRSL